MFLNHVRYLTALEGFNKLETLNRRSNNFPAHQRLGKKAILRTTLSDAINRISYRNSFIRVASKIKYFPHPAGTSNCASPQVLIE